MAHAAARCAAGLACRAGAQRAVLSVLRDAGYLDQSGMWGYFQSSEAAVQRMVDTEVPAEVPPAF